MLPYGHGGGHNRKVTYRLEPEIVSEIKLFSVRRFCPSILSRQQETKLRQQSKEQVPGPVRDFVLKKKKMKVKTTMTSMAP